MISKTTARRFVLGRQGLWPGRRWGYYTLPILYGDRLVARLDPKLERATGTLAINGFWLEEHAPVESPAFASALARGLARFAGFLAARRVDMSVLEPTTLRTRVREHLGTALEYVGDR